jgi:hypothetical protein
MANHQAPFGNFWAQITTTRRSPSKNQKPQINTTDDDHHFGTSEINHGVDSHTLSPSTLNLAMIYCSGLHFRA